MLGIKAHTQDTERYLAGLAKDQYPFATSKGLNDLAFAFTGAQKAGIEERFTVRRKWVLGHVRFDAGDRSTKTRLKATVRMEDQSSVFAGRSLLAKFERGGRKLASESGKNFPGIGKQLAIPIDAPTDASGVVQRAFNPTSLGLAEFRRGAKGSFHGTPALRGKRRTFVIPPDRSFGLPHGGIMQRTGPGPRDVRLLFVFKPSVPVPPLLEFALTAQRVVDEEAQEIFRAAWELALRTAR